MIPVKHLRYAALNTILFLFLAAASLYAAVPLDALNALTGDAHTRIVWIEGGDRLMGGGRLMGYDSRENVVREVLAADSNQNRPLLCSGGYRIAVTIDYKVYIVNFDGSGKRFIADGFCSDVWIDPVSGLEWAVVRAGKDSTNGAIRRYLIEDPAQSALLWDQSPAGDYYMGWYQISADGKVAVDFLPWDKCFVIDNGGLAANGLHTFLSRGCWSSLSPDNSYVWFCFPGQTGHTSIALYRYKTSLGTPLQINAGPLPEETTDEYYHPRFTSHGERFLILTGGYAGAMNSPLAEVYIGRLAADYKSFTGWVRITDNGVADHAPDAWVGVAPPQPCLHFSADTLWFEAQENGAAPQSRQITVTTPTGVLDGLTVSADQAWLSVSATGGAAHYVIANDVDVSSLSSGIHGAAVTVAAPNASPPIRTCRVLLTVFGTPVPYSIAAVPQQTVVARGGSIRIDALVLDQHQLPLETQPLLNWSVTGPAEDVSVTDGIFAAGMTPGVYTITVRSGALEAQVRVTVLEFIPVHIKVNCGDPSLGSIAGWEGDAKYVTPGSENAYFEYPVNVDVSGVSIPPPVEVYNTFRHMDHGYDFPDVPPGEYTVRMHFVEVFRSGEQRMMEITVEDAVVNNEFNILEAAGGVRNRAVGLDLPVTVDADGLQIALHGVSQSACINALEIMSAATAASPITLLEPLGGARFDIGDVLTVRWTATTRVAGVVVQLSVDDGDHWYSIVSSAIVATEPGWGRHDWPIPSEILGVSLVSDNARIRIYNYQDESIDAISPAPFSIMAGGNVRHENGIACRENLLLTSDGAAVIAEIPWRGYHEIIVTDLTGRLLVRRRDNGPRFYRLWFSGIERVLVVRVIAGGQTHIRRLVLHQKRYVLR